MYRAESMGASSRRGSDCSVARGDAAESACAGGVGGGAEAAGVSVDTNGTHASGCTTTCTTTGCSSENRVARETSLPRIPPR